MADDDREVPVDVVDELPGPLEAADAAVVCARVDDIPRPVPGSVKRSCARCGADVWLSPGVRIVLARQSEQPPIGCVECVIEVAGDGDLEDLLGRVE